MENGRLLSIVHNCLPKNMAEFSKTLKFISVLIFPGKVGRKKDRIHNLKLYLPKFEISNDIPISTKEMSL